SLGSHPRARAPARSGGAGAGPRRPALVARPDVRLPWTRARALGPHARRGAGARSRAPVSLLLHPRARHAARGGDAGGSRSGRVAGAPGGSLRDAGPESPSGRLRILRALQRRAPGRRVPPQPGLLAAPRLSGARTLGPRVVARSALRESPRPRRLGG